MVNLFVPTSKNNFYAHLIRVPALIIFSVFLLTFNLIAKSNISAQDYSQSINIENLISQHNIYRAENGLTNLQLNTLLNRSAQAKADLMLSTNCWSHYCPEGVEPWNFFDEAGYQYIYAGENLAEGFTRMEALMNAWKNSKTHRDNILKSEFNEVGFGLANGNYQSRSDNLVIVVHFGQQAQLISNNVTSQNSIEVLSPRINEIIDSSTVNVDGTAENIDEVRIYNNSTLKGSANIIDGIFTFRIEDPVQGKNILEVKSIDDTVDLKALIEYSVNLPREDLRDSLVITSQSSLPFEITNFGRTAVNLTIISILIILFLIDFVIISRNHLIRHKRSFSHYHLSLLVIVGLLILVGGFAGNVDVGVFK